MTTSPESPRRRPGRPKKSAADAKTKGNLSSRQRRILEVIKDSTVLRGYPPSIREIADAVGLQSTSSVSYQLKQLEEKGFLRREDNKPRAFDVRGYEDHANPGPATPVSRKQPKPTPAPISDDRPAATYVPVVGQIAAGNPILAEQNIEAQFPLPAELVGTSEELFLLQVVGESMRDAGIYDSDWVVVRSQPTADQGDFVAAMIDWEATVKELHHDEDGVWLLPHNDLFEPIAGNEAQILGKVSAVLRKI